MNRRDQLIHENRALARFVVARFLRRVTLPTSFGYDEEDLLGEAYLALCRAADRWEPDRGAFSTYAATVMHHALLNVCEKMFRGSVPEVLSLDASAEEDGESFIHRMPDPTPGPEEKAVRQETVRAVRRAVSRLLPADTGVLEARLAGTAASDLARERGCSRQRIDQVYQRGVRRLKRELEGVR